VCRQKCRFDVVFVLEALIPPTGSTRKVSTMRARRKRGRILCFFMLFMLLLCCICVVYALFVVIYPFLVFIYVVYNIVIR